MSDWLAGFGVTHVGMEATGVYWKPVWHVLEGGFELVLANAAHIRNVPGRKSDVTDTAWIADLLAHGLIRGSFVPPAAVQELRDLTRTRKQRVRELGQHVQRIHKTLEDANVKLASVISDVVGASGRAILEALIAGETDPERLAARGHGRLRCPHEELVPAPRGRVTAHHGFLLQQHLKVVDSLQARIAEFEARIGDGAGALAPGGRATRDHPGGEHDRGARHRGAFLNYQHVTKWAEQVIVPEAAPDALRRAFTQVRNGRPRPVLVEFPVDMAIELKVMKVATEKYRSTDIRATTPTSPARWAAGASGSPSPAPSCPPSSARSRRRERGRRPCWSSSPRRRSRAPWNV